MYAVCCAVCCMLYIACYFEGPVRGAHVEGVRGDVCGMLCCMLYIACYFEGAVRGAHVEGVKGDVCGMLCCMLYAVYLNALRAYPATVPTTQYPDCNMCPDVFALCFFMACAHNILLRL